VRQIRELTGLPPRDAVKLLAANDWSEQAAADAFFGESSAGPSRSLIFPIVHGSHNFPQLPRPFATGGGVLPALATQTAAASGDDFSDVPLFAGNLATPENVSSDTDRSVTAQHSRRQLQIGSISAPHSDSNAAGLQAAAGDSGAAGGGVGRRPLGAR
jgi:hypothetical protein